MYRLSPIARDEISLCFRMEGDPGERHGSIGCLRADFGTDGRGFWTTWFDYQKHLKTPAFKAEFDNVINSLRDDGQEPPFASHANFEAFCLATPGVKAPERGAGYMVRTQVYSYYFRCKPGSGDCSIYCFSYDNRYLLPELAGQHKLPADCYSVLPSSGELIMIVRDKYGYFPSPNSTPFPDINRKIADESNTHSGVTRAQEEAMLAGSLFGWNVPAAKPWNYNQDGSPRPLPPKEKDRDAR
jgi:hypothetical protein